MVRFLWICCGLVLSVFVHAYIYIHIYIHTVTTFKYVEGGPDRKAPEVV